MYKFIKVTFMIVAMAFMGFFGIMAYVFLTALASIPGG